jgi:hypothetical protein
MDWKKKLAEYERLHPEDAGAKFTSQEDFIDPEFGASDEDFLIRNASRSEGASQWETPNPADNVDRVRDYLRWMFDQRATWATSLTPKTLSRSWRSTAGFTRRTSIMPSM